MRVYSGDTISSIYEELMRDVILHGLRKNPRGKWTKELHPVVIELKNSSLNKFLLIPNRGMNYAFALAEIVWILSGRGDYEYIGFYNKAMGKYLDDTKGLIDFKGLTTTHDFHASYGKRIRRAGYAEPTAYSDFGQERFRGIDKEDTAKFQSMFSTNIEIDQLQMVYEKFQEDMNTRQAVVDLWDVKKDNTLRAKDYPCNTQIMFKIIQGKLDISVIRRSNDIVWGLPYNIIQFTSIQEYMAGWLGVEVGKYYEFIDSLHIYEDEYPELYKFFSDKVAKKEQFVLNLESINNIALTSEICSKAEIDRVLNYFMKSELEWRMRIKPDTHSDVIKLYVDRWLGELMSVSTSYYWRYVYTFMLTHHLYKAKHYEKVKELVFLKLNDVFKVMAAETFEKLSKDIIKDVNFGALNKLVQRDMIRLYKEASND